VTDIAYLYAQLAAFDQEAIAASVDGDAEWHAEVEADREHVRSAIEEAEARGVVVWDD
jgi:hypothetical protein